MKKMVSTLPALTLSLILAACGGEVSDGTTHVTALTDSGAGSLRQAIADAKAGDTLKLTAAGTITLASPITTDKNLTIMADGVTLDAHGAGRVLEVPAGVTVTIKGGTLTGGVGQIIATSLRQPNLQESTSMLPSAVKLSAQADPQPTWGGVILNRGTLTLEGVTVSGGKANLGGGIYVADTGTLTLNTGTKVTGNAAEKSDFDGAAGGGIYNHGTLNINGGAVDANTAYYVGGGINNQGILTISTGSVSENSCLFPFSGTTSADATGCSGGGIRTVGPTTITGGDIKNNVATYFGGGVSAQVKCKDSTCKPEEYIYSLFNMSGGTVEGNKTTGTADNGGGGLWLRANATISGGTIKGNSSMYGGGIWSWYKLDITGGSIEGNTASVNGGGVGGNIAQNTGVKLTIGGTASIKNNTAKSGGGLYLMNYTQADITGGSISGNSAIATDNGGGGIRLTGNSSLTMSNGEVKSNTAAHTGGGILVGSNTTFNLSGGLIDSNTVTATTNDGGGGGIRLYAASKMTASGGTISNNSATYGGGIKTDGSYQTAPASEFTLAGATITGNKTTKSVGGGLFNDGKSTLTSGSVTGNSVVAGQGGGGVFNTKVSSYTAASGIVAGNTPDDVLNEQ